MEQQCQFYAPADGSESAGDRWLAVLAEREATYMTEARDEDRRDQDVAGGGYQEVAWRLMTALATGSPATMILDVPNGGLVPQLPPETVIEVACQVGADGVHPLPISPPTLEQHGLMARLRAAEQFAMEACLSGDRDLAWRAFAEHPLVNSPVLGKRLLAGYLLGHRQLAEIFAPRGTGNSSLVEPGSAR